MISRQKLTGWALVIFAGGYLVYAWKTRLLVPPPLETSEWLRIIGMVLLLMIGTANIRLANMRAQKPGAEQQKAD